MNRRKVWKSILCCFLILVIMSGCASREIGDLSVQDSLHVGTLPTVPENGEEDAVSNITRKTYFDALFLYEDRILYQRTGKKGIYQIKDGMESTLASVGNLLGLYGSVVLAEDHQQQLMLLNLAKEEDWVSLPIKRTDGFSVAQDGNLLHIFTKTHRNNIDLTTMEQTQDTVGAGARSALVENGVLYFVRSRMEAGVLKAWLYRSMEGKEEQLCTVGIDARLRKVGDRILIYGQTQNPALYDLSMGTCTDLTAFDHPQNSTHLYGDLVVSWFSVEGKKWYYDIAAGKELSLSETDLDERDSFIADNVCYRVDLEKRDRFFCKADGYEFTLDGIDGPISRLAANEHFCVALTTDKEVPTILKK